MADGKRVPGVMLLGVIVLIGSIAGPAWYFTRPVPKPDPGPNLEDLNVVCNGRVDVEGSLISLDPSQPGRVLEVYVRENTPLAAETPILKLDDTIYQSALQEALAARDAVAVEMQAAEHRAKQHPDQIALAEKRIAAAEAEVTAAERQREQMKSRSDLTGQITAVDVEIFDAKLKQVRLVVEAQKLERDQLRKLDPELETKAVQARKVSADLAVERAKKGIADCILRAPAAGTLLRLQTARGGTLAPGLPVASVIFAPAGPLIVRAEIDQASLGRVRVGAKAIVRDDARVDSPQWAGRVREIAGWIAPRRSLLLEPGELNDVRTTEAIVEIEPAQELLRVGQRMVITIER